MASPKRQQNKGFTQHHFLHGHDRAKNGAGFTLVEMLVAISLFTVVVTMSVSSLLVLIDANGRAQSMQLVMTNLSFSLDSMTREIRTGYNWYCINSGDPTNPPSIPARADIRGCDVTAGHALSIVESGSSLTDALACHASESCSHRVTYWFDPDAYGAGHGAIKRRLGTDSEGGGWVALTGPEIWVDDFVVQVHGAPRFVTAGDTDQPVATFYLKGRAGVESSDPTREREFAIQTSISQRLLDI